MADFQKVANLSDVKEGRLKGVWFENESVLLANVKGKIFAIGNICTHMGCNLSEGDLSGTTLTCPCHGSQFNVTNGKVVNPPARKDEPTYEVKIEGQTIMIRKG